MYMKKDANGGGTVSGDTYDDTYADDTHDEDTSLEDGDHVTGHDENDSHDVDQDASRDEENGSPCPSVSDGESVKSDSSKSTLTQSDESSALGSDLIDVF